MVPPFPVPRSLAHLPTASRRRVRWCRASLGGGWPLGGAAAEAPRRQPVTSSPFPPPASPTGRLAARTRPALTSGGPRGGVSSAAERGGDRRTRRDASPFLSVPWERAGLRSALTKRSTLPFWTGHFSRIDSSCGLDLPPLGSKNFSRKMLLRAPFYRGRGADAGFVLRPSPSSGLRLAPALFGL